MSTLTNDSTTLPPELTLQAYPGDGAVLLAFDADESLIDDLAGFAVEYIAPDGTTHQVLNRLNFEHPLTAATTPEERTYLPTREAPLQKFRWVSFPPDLQPGKFRYRATAMLFAPGSEDAIQPGPSTEIEVELYRPGSKFNVGFSRGYVSSQAYTDKFDHTELQPHPQTIDFDTSPYEQQYKWLGAHARKLVFEFLAEVASDDRNSLDVFAFDLDEPDFVRKLKALGSRVRLYLDSSADHVKPEAHELAAKAALTGSPDPVTVRTGHFSGLAHSKVLILKRGDQALKVLAGSANFSVRGLYVQSNNVFVIDDPATAALYDRAFEQAWSDAPGFSTSEIAAKWFECGGNGLPSFAVSFAPHHESRVSLDRATEAVRQAESSVLFAIMEIGAGSGELLDEIRNLPNRADIYAFGTTQRLNGDLKVHAHGDHGVFIPFSYLKGKVPPPFRQEWSGGAGQVIHHKFVVVDFNGSNPKVFTGSSNLAAGGEHENGDNLVAISDRYLAELFAVEAIQLIDHYRFRAVMEDATDAEPLKLRTRSGKWAAEYYDPTNPKYRERTLFAHPQAARD